MKVIARTREAIMLIDPTTGAEVANDRPYVVAFTPFFEARTGKGEIEVLETGLPDEATDAEFQVYLKDSDGNVDLAIAAFLSKGEPEAKPKPKAAPKAKGA